MPRRPPAAVRATLVRHHRRRPQEPWPAHRLRIRLDVPGLSASTMRQLRALDRRHGWPDNWTAWALLDWCRMPRKPRPRHQIPWHGDHDWRANVDHPRVVIEIVLGQVSKRARRQLRRLITPADERRQRLWLPNPFARPELPWWLRTLDS